MATQARYKGARCSKPRTANEYAALEETYQYTFNNEDPEPDTILFIRNANDMNQIYAFEPLFRATDFINVSSPLCYAMFQRYDEFRIRSVEVRLTEASINPTNISRSDVWVWWCPNHYEEDEDSKIGEVFDDVQSLQEAARVQHLSVAPGHTVVLNVVPQVTMIQQNQTVGGAILDQHGDRPAPWLKNTVTNTTDILMRMPILYFRKPYAVGTNVPLHYPAYQVMLKAIIEFRNLDDDN